LLFKFTTPILKIFLKLFFSNQSLPDPVFESYLKKKKKKIARSSKINNMKIAQHVLKVLFDTILC